MDALERRQRDLNRTSVDHWSLFEGHRRRVTDVILAQMAGEGDDVCIVGAGNCNDVDLPTLWRAGARLHLVDIDGAAVHDGIARQASDGDGAARVHDGIDVTGVLGAFMRAARVDADQAIDDLIRAAPHPPPLDLHVPMDVAVSVCLLSQLIATVEEAVGKGHPRIEEVADALRAGHLRALLRLVGPGGRVIVVTEVASDENVPAVADAPDEHLGGLLLRAIVTRDLFTGLGPEAMVSWVIRNRPLGARLLAPGLVGPWRWRLSPRRAYLVVGVLLRRP